MRKKGSKKRENKRKAKFSFILKRNILSKKERFRFMPMHDIRNTIINTELGRFSLLQEEKRFELSYRIV